MYKFKKHNKKQSHHKALIEMLKAILLLGSLGYLVYKYHKQILSVLKEVKKKLDQVDTGDVKDKVNAYLQAADANKDKNKKANNNSSKQPSDKSQNTNKKKKVQINSKRYEDLLARQQEVYNLIKKLGEATLTDVAARVTNVSKRTLRRDMDSLEEQGLVKQVGKTRDSHYQAV